jgi:hypothetical protein
MLRRRVAQQFEDAETSELIYRAREPRLLRSKAMFVPANPSSLPFSNAG